MNATNTFQNGLVMDSHPLATSNDVLTNCLNGTLITYNGNELILQNDVGNSKIKDPDGKYVTLNKGFVPIGLKEFGGILYIFSVNPNTNYCEIGTYPSPDYSKKEGKLIYKYQPLNNYNKGSFTTKRLNFDVEHPLTIDCQKSYDGSINLIFTDNKNIPRLINTRFSLYGDNEYEIIDRSGERDTNVYNDDDAFEYETALHKIVNKIVKIDFKGVQTGGNLKVGTYTFYFTLADSDDNESDFVGQSSIVTCHKGNLNDPFSVDGGVENENSYKQVRFTLSNLPKQFSRVYVYYSRNSSDASGNPLTTYAKLNKYFTIIEDKCNVLISGFEAITDVSETTINTKYLTINTAKAQSINQNILFYGNIKEKAEYQELKEWSLNEENIKFDFIYQELGEVNPDYSYATNNDEQDSDKQGGYYNVENIYNYTGYWPGEYYRFGVVYIMDDYSLSPVFNIRGNIEEETTNDKNQSIIEKNKYGIIQFPEEFDLNKTKPVGIKFILKERPEHTIGQFFVRQKRIKTVLAQGVRIGSDQKFSYLPLLYYDKNINSDKQNKKLLWVFYKEHMHKHEGSDEYVSEAAVIFTDNERPLYGDEAIGFFRGYHEETGYFIDLPSIYYYYDSLKYEQQINGIELGWFTESFAHGMQNVRFDNMLIYDVYGLWKKNGWEPPVLGESFIGSEQVRRFLTVGGSNEHSPLTSQQVNAIVSDAKGKRKKDEPAVSSPEADALIVPEYEIKQQEYNQIFNGSKLQYKKIGKYSDIDVKDKIFYTSSFIENINEIKDAHIIAVPEGTGAVRAKNKVYSSIAGNAAEGHRIKVPFTNYRIVADTYKNKELNGIDLLTEIHDLTWPVRGIYGPYVGIEEEQSDGLPYDVVNIYIPEKDKLGNNDIISTRRDDSSEYYPISERSSNLIQECYRGDTFICNFTHTMNRNFADPSFPINTEIADNLTWAKGAGRDRDSQNKIAEAQSGSNTCSLIFYKYDLSQHTDSLELLNRSDVNAVSLGHKFTTKVYSSTNLCMRSTDGSNITERATFNQVRTFYPLSYNGAGVVPNKISDSYVQNGAYEKSLGEQIYTLQEDLPALKTNFSNRIVYSDIAVKDAYINNFRVFRKAEFQDYTRQYGEIVKLINYDDQNLLCIFEHAIAIIGVNEKAIATNSESGFAYIDVAKVISDTPTFISTEFGSQWADSVIKTSTGVYGIDTVAKKIWHVATSFEVLSDLRIQKFLKDNLDVVEQETKPNVTKLNIKSHYNKHKQDIMFTFFRVNEVENGIANFIGWNVCYNEITKKWTTFYSWIPSYSGNINNIFYSFDNDYSIGNIKDKKIDDQEIKSALLWEHNKENNWCNWYDEQHPFEFEFIVADHPNVHKIFNNLKIIANKTQPESFHYEVVGQVYDFKQDKKNMYYR